MQFVDNRYGPFVFHAPAGEVVSPDLVVMVTDVPQFDVRVGLYVDQAGLGVLATVFKGMDQRLGEGASVFLALSRSAAVQAADAVESCADPVGFLFDTRRPASPMFDLTKYSLRGVDAWVPDDAVDTKAAGLDIASSKPRVLVVEPDSSRLKDFWFVLSGAPEWEATFVSSGAAAVEALENLEYQVVAVACSVDEGQIRPFLEVLESRFPELSRIVIGDGTEATLAAAVPNAQQWTPADAVPIAETVRRATALQRIMRDSQISDAVGQMGDLPVLPTTYARICRAMADSRVGIAAVGPIVEADVGLAGRVLKLVNSAFFALPRKVGGISQAVGLLGLRRLRDLVLMLEVFDQLQPLVEGFSMPVLQVRSLGVAGAATSILQGHPQADDVFTAGILHDIGRLMLTARAPELYTRVLRRVGKTGGVLIHEEVEVMGVNHNTVAGFLLADWGLPASIVEAVLHRESPDAAAAREFGLVGALHVATALADEFGPPLPGGQVTLDLEYLRAVGVLDQVGAWRGLVRSQFGG